MATIHPTAEQGGQTQAEIHVTPWFGDEISILSCSTVNADGSGARTVTIFLNTADRAALVAALTNQES